MRKQKLGVTKLKCLTKEVSTVFVLSNIIGGRKNICHKRLSSFLVYNTKMDKWIQKADISMNRLFLACTLFEGKIVVSGGMSDFEDIKSVEAYDYYENKWTYLPDMIEGRCVHASVSMGNKMFVIGGSDTSSYEVFDSYSRKFTSIKSLRVNVSLP